MSLWFLIFVFSIGSGGFFALAVALARTPLIEKWIPKDIFYHWLIGHVDLALIVALLSFFMFVSYRVLDEEEDKFSTLLVFVGALGVFFSSLFGLGTPVHNNYVPTISHWVFFISLILLGVGFSVACIRLLGKAVKSFSCEDPLERFVSVGILLLPLFPLSVLVTYFKVVNREEIHLFFERLYWLGGHIHQFVNASLLVSLWTLMVQKDGKKLPGVVKFLPFFLIPFPLSYAFLSFLPKDPLSFKELTTLGYAVGIGLATIPYSFWILLKVQNFTLKASSLLYILGALMGYLIAGSDLKIPAHYHGVIASILISVMGVTYLYLRETCSLNLRKLPSFQIGLYAVGMILFVLGLFWAGTFGAPRKTPGTAYIENPELILFMALMGIGSVLSVLGGVLFVGLVIYTTVRCKR